MTGLDALQSVQFVTAGGKRLAVISAEDWEAMIEWNELSGLRGPGRLGGAKEAARHVYADEETRLL